MENCVLHGVHILIIAYSVKSLLTALQSLQESVFKVEIEGYEQFSRLEKQEKRLFNLYALM